MGKLLRDKARIDIVASSKVVDRPPATPLQQWRIAAGCERRLLSAAVVRRPRPQAHADMLEACLGASLQLFGLPGAWWLARRLGLVPDVDGAPAPLLGSYCALVRAANAEVGAAALRGASGEVDAELSPVEAVLGYTFTGGVPALARPCLPPTALCVAFLFLPACR